jgi:RimJ/RimL family protein N-acetyltransferase
MDSKITYIIATWLGKRRAEYYNTIHDPYFLIKQHVTNLSILECKSIEKILIVINEYDIAIDDGLSIELDKLNIKIPYEIIKRPNIGFSYAAWEHGIQYCLDNNSNSEYFFLIEDDYVPVADNFYSYFINQSKQFNAGVVTQLYTNLLDLQYHAAISNCLIKKSDIELCIQENDNIFKLKLGKTYLDAQDNQVIFLDYLSKITNIVDVSEQTCIPFYDINIDSIRLYGNTTKPVILYPIYKLDMLSFRKMSIDDVSFVNNIRNEYCDDYLHTTRKFTIDESIDWFKKTNPDYYIIEYGNKPIGYFRLSNYSAENNNILIGADIHPDYTGLKLAYPAYVNFINYLFYTLKLNKISLEVLETNQRAINLYNKIGFIQEGVKRQEVLKKDKYINSIIMSILKSEWK